MANQEQILTFDEPPYAKPGSKVAERWKGIRSGITVAAALEKGATLGDIRYAVAQGRAKLGTAKAKAKARRST